MHDASSAQASVNPTSTLSSLLSENSPSISLARCCLLAVCGQQGDNCCRLSEKSNGESLLSGPRIGGGENVDSINRRAACNVSIQSQQILNLQPSLATKTCFNHTLLQIDVKEPEISLFTFITIIKPVFQSFVEQGTPTHSLPQTSSAQKSRNSSDNIQSYRVLELGSFQDGELIKHRPKLGLVPTGCFFNAASEPATKIASCSR